MFVSALCCLRMRYSSFEGGVSHGFRMELAPFGPARAAWLFTGARVRARAVFAAVGRNRCSQRGGAGTFVGESMNTLRLTSLSTNKEAPVGTALDFGGVSNAMALW